MSAYPIRLSIIILIVGRGLVVIIRELLMQHQTGGLGGHINSMVIRDWWIFWPRGGRCVYKPIISQFWSKSVDELVHLLHFPLGMNSFQTEKKVRPLIQLISQLCLGRE